jgi:hypothetical protein
MNLRDILSHVSVTTLLLAFLFFCGTLYIISYWSTFNFDITNYIELFDIPKSFVFPLATGLGVALLSLVVQGMLNVSKAQHNAAPKSGIRILKKFRWVNSNSVTFLAIIICMLFYDPYSEWIVIAGGMTLCIWSFRKMYKSHYVVTLIPYQRARFFFAVLITFIPVYSVCMGKLNSIAVWKNRNYYSVAHIVYEDPTFKENRIIGKKLLGKIGSFIIVTDSTNASITVLSLGRVQFVEYRLTRSGSLLDD